MKEVAIVSGSRTAIGTFGSGLKDIPVTELGAVVMKDVLKRANLRPVPNDTMKAAAPDKLKDKGLTELETKSYDWNDNDQSITLDEVVMGNVLQAGQGQNTARQSMIAAGIPKETPAYTINKVCGSGLKAIALGASAIMLGQADVVLAGGQESMSLVPMALPKARCGKYFTAITWALQPRPSPPCMILAGRSRTKWASSVTPGHDRPLKQGSLRRRLRP
jgi:acetyl-CoA C-acetyltransferase